MVEGLKRIAAAAKPIEVEAGRCRPDERVVG